MNRIEHHTRVLALSLVVLVRLVLSPLLVSPAVVHAGATANEPIEVGQKKQLFLDDYLVASATNVIRTIHPAEKCASNPVIRQTEPWEDPLNILYGSVIREGDQYRAWYKSGPGVSYAVSDDGVHWVKPALDLVP